MECPLCEKPTSVYCDSKDQWTTKCSECWWTITTEEAGENSHKDLVKSLLSHRVENVGRLEGTYNNLKLVTFLYQLMFKIPAGDIADLLDEMDADWKDDRRTSSVASRFAPLLRAAKELVEKYLLTEPLGCKKCSKTRSEENGDGLLCMDCSGAEVNEAVNFQLDAIEKDTDTTPP